jgi:hypothetical protein
MEARQSTIVDILLEVLVQRAEPLGIHACVGNGYFVDEFLFGNVHDA